MYADAFEATLLNLQRADEPQVGMYVCVYCVRMFDYPAYLRPTAVRQAIGREQQALKSPSCLVSFKNELVITSEEKVDDEEDDEDEDDD